MSALDKAAEAIWATNPASRAFFGYTWDNDLISEDERDAYRRMAQAAIDALEISQERRTNVMSSAGMTIDSRTGITTAHSDIRYDVRLVSPWRAEGGE